MAFTTKELRKEIRRSFPVFCKAAYPDYETAPHLRRLQSALMLLENGYLDRLIISMPPRHGKSLTTSQLFPAWFLGRNPDKQVMLTSYSGGLAGSFGRRALAFMKSHAFSQAFGTASGGRVRLDPRTPQQINLMGYEGTIRSAGVGGSITGFGADLLIVDDPVKDAQAAMSTKIRSNTWDWFTSTAYTRLMPNAKVCIIMTRWHEDDLVGRLLSQMNSDNQYSEDWTILRLPAINSEGVALWPERYDVPVLRRIAATVGTRVWEALYQGNPSPPEGSLVHRSWFRTVQVPPAGENIARVRYWDFAATEEGGDWTVGLLMSMTPSGIFTIEDVVRGQWGSASRNIVVKQVTESDAMLYGNVYTFFEVEGGSSGKDMELAIVNMLAGYPVFPNRPTKNKAVRFDPFRSQAQVGNVRLVAGRWMKDYLDELAMFPYGSSDDQVDATSGAFNALTATFSNFAAFLQDRYGFAAPQMAQSGYTSISSLGGRKVMTEREKELLEETGYAMSEEAQEALTRSYWDYLIEMVKNPDILNDIIYRRFRLYLTRDTDGEYLIVDDCLVIRSSATKDVLQSMLDNVGARVVGTVELDDDSVGDLE